MTILYFAWVKARIGRAEETLTPPASVRTVAALLAWLVTQSPGHAAAFVDLGQIRVAINQEHAGLEAAIAVGDEVAFFPPVTGG